MAADARALIIIQAKDNATVVLNNLGKALGNVEKEAEKTSKAGAFLTGIWQGMGQRAAGLVAQIPRVAAETLKLGMSQEAASRQFVRFAGGADRAQEMLDAFNRASLGTVTRMTAMQTGGRLMQMGLVRTSDEMEKMVAIAVRLGNQTLSVEQRVSNFSLLLANQAKRRLDDFGIGVQQANAAMEKFKAEGFKDQEAFKMAVLDVGTRALEKLGDTSDLVSVKVSAIGAAAKDAQTGLGEMASLMLGRLMNAIFQSDKGFQEFLDRIRALPITLGQSLVIVLDLLGKLGIDTEKAILGVAAVLDQMQLSAHEGEAAFSDMADQVAEGAAEMAQKMEEASLAMGVGFTKFFQNQADAEVNWQQKREQENQAHLDRIADIREDAAKKGTKGTFEWAQARVMMEEQYYRKRQEMIEADIKREKEQQRQRLGTWLSQQAKAWAEARGLSANEALQMQLNIAREYGLISQAGVQAAQKQTQAWETMYGKMEQGAAQAVAKVESHYDTALKRLKAGKIEWFRMLDPATGKWKTITAADVTSRQHGGFTGGGLTMMNERGPELARLPSGTYIHPNRESEMMVNAAAMMLRGSQGGGPRVQIGTLVLPNVTSAEQFLAELRDIS